MPASRLVKLVPSRLGSLSLLTGVICQYRTLKKVSVAFFLLIQEVVDLTSHTLFLF